MLKQIKRKIALDKAASKKLDSIIDRFDKSEYGTDEYYKALGDLQKLQSVDKDRKKSHKVDPSIVVALVSTLGGLIGTALILDYETEKGGIITTSAKAFINKLGR